MRNKLRTDHPFGLNTSYRQGFSLIELLVVVAIIAILAAILFPVFASARERARSTSCLNNQKQIGIAFRQYREDYDERYPPYPENPIAPWRQDLQPYLGKNTVTHPNAVYNCPSASDSGDPTDPRARYSDYGTGSYAFNGWLYNCQPEDVKDPTGTMTLADGSRFDTWPLPGQALTVDPAKQNSNCGSGMPTLAIKRHNDGVNMTFEDGHSRWISIRKLPTVTYRSNPRLPLSLQINDFACDSNIPAKLGCRDYWDTSN